MSSYKVVVPETTTNLHQNPSAETVTTGYTVGSGALTRIATDQRRGAYCLQYIPAAGTTDGYYYSITLAAATVHSWSLDFKGANGIPYKIRVYDVTGAADVTSQTITGTAEWTRLELTNFTTTSNTSYRLYVEKNSSASTANFYTDGWQVETKAYATTYCDGDQPGCYWNQGTAHVSATSTRTAQSRQGGRIRDLEDVYSFKVLACTGGGAGPVRNITIPYGRLPGSLHQYTAEDERAMTLIGRFNGSSMANLHSLRKALLAVIRHNGVSEPQPLLWQYTGSGTTLEVSGYYDGGLEVAGVTRAYERLPLRLRCPDPYWYGPGEHGASLTARATDANANSIMQRGTDGDWDAMGTGVAGGSATVMALARDRNKRLYVGGDFTTANGVTVNNVTYWTGSTFAAMGTTGANDVVRALVVGSDGIDIYTGGDFTAAGGVANTSRIALWNGSAWSALGTGAADAVVYALALAPDGSLYAGGTFSLMGGVANTVRIAKWDGSAWSALSTGANGAVYALAVGPDGTLYAGGDFSTIGGQTISYLAKWNGTAWSAVGDGVNSTVYALTFGPDGTLYVGGLFTTAGEDVINRIAAWDGVNFRPLGTGIGGSGAIAVRSIFVDADNQVYVGGNSFSDAGGRTLPDNVAVWNGYVWLPLDVDLPGSAVILALHKGSEGVLTVGYDQAGTATFAAVNSVTYNGDADGYPVIVMTGPGVVYQLVNFYEDKDGNQASDAIYFDLELESGEEATLDLRFGRKTFVSSWRGNIAYTILPGSDLATFRLHNGANNISLFINQASASAKMYWRNAYLSWDADE